MVLLLFPVRYFKQIAKSVRANGSASSGSEENADDFLGCINIPLNVSVTKQPDPVGIRAADRAFWGFFWRRKCQSWATTPGLSWSRGRARQRSRASVT